MSHSKRNTSRPVFTAHERTLAKAAWSASSARLSRESFLPFSSCALCLEPARDPVACTHGDVFCRECALSNILAQKKEIKRLERLREQEGRDRDDAQARLDAEAKERAIREFEMTQNGLGARSSSSSLSAAAAGGGGTGEKEGATQEKSGGLKKGEKRKFEMDEEELLRIATEDRTKARKALDDEKAAKPTLPSFWTPSITPTSNTKDTLHEIARKTKSTPTCPASPEDKPHTYSLHTLVTVNFTEEEEREDERTKMPRRICPSCRKVLSNASKAMLAKPCGHVLCRSCVDRFMRSSKHHDPHATAQEKDSLRCYVCEADLVDRKDADKREKDEKSKKKDKDKIRPGLVDLRSEGTGFSAGGANQVQKSGVAFQC